MESKVTSFFYLLFLHKDKIKDQCEKASQSLSPNLFYVGIKSEIKGLLKQKDLQDKREYFQYAQNFLNLNDNRKDFEYFLTSLDNFKSNCINDIKNLLEILEKFQEFIKEEDSSKNDFLTNYNQPVPLNQNSKNQTHENIVKENREKAKAGVLNIIENKEGDYTLKSSFEMMNKEAENKNGGKEINEDGKKIMEKSREIGKNDEASIGNNIKKDEKSKYINFVLINDFSFHSGQRKPKNSWNQSGER